jgi:hypothetical protein
VQGPISFIHDLCGLPAGAGGASFLPDVFVQYFSKKLPDTHFCRDPSSDASSTPLSAIDLYSSLDRLVFWRSESVGRGFESTTLFGRGVASRTTTSSTTGVASCGVGSFGVGAFVAVFRRFASRARPDARRFSAISFVFLVIMLIRSSRVDKSCFKYSC